MAMGEPLHDLVGLEPIHTAQKSEPELVFVEVAEQPLQTRGILKGRASQMQGYAAARAQVPLVALFQGAVRQKVRRN